MRASHRHATRFLGCRLRTGGLACPDRDGFRAGVGPDLLGIEGLFGKLFPGRRVRDGFGEAVSARPVAFRKGVEDEAFDRMEHDLRAVLEAQFDTFDGGLQLG